MTGQEALQAGRGLLRKPLFVVVFALLGIFQENLGFLHPVFALPLYIFTAPLLLSWILSYFFLETVGGGGSTSEHKNFALNFYFPFLKIFVMFVSFVFLLRAAMYLIGEKVMHVSLHELVYDMSADIIYVVYMFVLGMCIFEKTNVWVAIKKSVAFINSHPTTYLIITASTLLIDVLYEIFKLHNLPVEKLLLACAVELVVSFVYLFFYRILITDISSSLGDEDRRGIFQWYLDANAKVKDAIRDEKKELERARSCLILGLLSFVPFVHLFAMYFGRKRFQSQIFGRTRSLAAFILGLFFTLMYGLALVGRFTLHWQAEVFSLPHTRTIDQYEMTSPIVEDIKVAIQKIKQNANEEAVALLKKHSVDNPEVVYFALGLAYANEQDLKQAKEMFTKCASLATHNGEALFHLGTVEMELEEYSQAKVHFMSFLARYPGDKETMKYIALLDNRVDWRENFVLKIIFAVILIFSVSCHEFAHAYTAFKCGDDAQRQLGRMTLNPLAHIDLFGSVIVPGLLILSKSSFLVGWAKPVLVHKESFKNPSRDEVLVSLSGCSTNILLALSASLLLAFMGLMVSILFPDVKTLHFFLPAETTSIIGVPWSQGLTYINIFLVGMIATNLGLAFFNLLPLPPLDGSWLFPHYLPTRLQLLYERSKKFTLLVLIVLLFTPLFDIIIGIPLGLFFMFLNLLFVPVLGLG